MTKNKLLYLLFVIMVVSIVSSCSSFTKPDQVEKPIFDPPGGSYDGLQTVTLYCSTLGATIYYTLDGSEPHSASHVYSEPIIISNATNIKAKAFRSGMRDSKTASEYYTIIYDPSRMVYVPSGTFHNGSSNVTVSSFYIGKYELTRAGYEAVMGTNPSWFENNPNHPVECVSWFDAIEYCNRRSIQEALMPCYSYLDYGTNPDNWPSGWNGSAHNHTNVFCSWTANGFRLPTEMEWMFASKGGNQSQGYTYSGSNNIDAVAWYNENSSSTTHQVGTKLPNELGMYDMSGNVWEWCWDIYGDYPSGPQTNPHGPVNGYRRAVRGGAFNIDAEYCTVSYRAAVYAEYDGDSIGFRVCRTSL